MNKASRDARSPRAMRDAHGPRVVAGLLAAATTLVTHAVAQPLPIDVTAAQHWVLYARLQGSEPFALADGSRRLVWWFDGQGRRLGASRLPPVVWSERLGHLGGRQDVVTLVHGSPSSDVARVEASPSAPPMR